ncbi:hypothetical protein Y1Q_0009471 [Alligator mississippiensis]|uniref:Uncharacterized protein n=1 Tax=Alligator mississippiensis TaxID=8496 RepID=A0A151M3N8_ALLMI|nr:hypothetical protein Y1Q_0009471 [Alligator mississippiensis]
MACKAGWEGPAAPPTHTPHTPPRAGRARRGEVFLETGRCQQAPCTSVQRAVALAEGFQLGQAEDEKLQVTMRVKGEEGSSDQMQPPGALPEPGDSWGQQPNAHGEDRLLEEAGERETSVPEGELPHVHKEEPPPNPEPGAGTLNRADQQPPKEGSVKLELQRPSLGRRGQSGSQTPGPGQLQEGQGRPAKQGESMEVSMAPAGGGGGSAAGAEPRRSQGCCQEFGEQRPEE